MRATINALWNRKMASITMENRGRGAGGDGDAARVDSRTDVSSRMADVANRYPSRMLAAKAARISTDQLARQIKGMNRPFFDTVARLCAGQGVSLDWVATGEGPMMRDDRLESGRAPASSGAVDRLDEALLGNLVQGLEDYLSRESLTPSPADHARLIVLLYRMMARRRAELRRQGAAVPDQLCRPGHPFDFAADPDLSDIVHLAS
ncbi:hypothetical protein [Azospirillum sp. A39]|uniref:hypothetical protein n=1 Tax=Azospirillum sp. A39 TaxID=3462279 RepID=UPI0040452011